MKATKQKTYKPLPLKNLSWPQAKVRFPNMKPYGDADKDGLKNKFDCKPFDRTRKGEEHDDEEVGGTYPKEWKEWVRKKEKEVEDYQKKHSK